MSNRDFVHLLAAMTLALAAMFCGCCTRPAGTSAGPEATCQLAVLQTFCGGGEGGWDDLTADAQARRVYVARSTRVMVFDADSGAVVGEVADTPGVHGVAIVHERNLGFTSNGCEGMVSVFDTRTLQTTQKIKAGEKPDAILYDPFSKRVYVFNGGSGDATIIDPASLNAEPVTLPIGGKLEFAVSDGGGRVYVNVEDKNEVAVIDSRTQQVCARWPITPGEGPTGLAIDCQHRRLFAGCSNQKMIVLDADKGAVLAAVPVGSGVDGAAYDDMLHVVVIPNGRDGTLTVIGEQPDGKYPGLQTLPTAKGARTVRVDEKTHHFLLPCTLPATSGNEQGKFGLLVVGVPPQGHR